MSEKRQSAGLLRELTLSAVICLIVGLVLALSLRPPVPFGMAVMGFSTLLASFFLGCPLGGKLDLERRYQKWRVREIAVICAITLAVGVLCYLIGLSTPPLIGQSENHVLFPALLLAGVFAGACESSSRFRRA